MAGRVGSCTVLVFLGALVAGCSLGQLDSQYGVDGSVDGASTADSGDTGATGDGSDASDGCSAVENCTNGIDDNCNGLVDCADPMCKTAGFACTAAAIPPGWTLVAFSATTRPVCPAVYGAEQAVVSGVSGAADTCGCTCSGTSATCGGQDVYIAYPPGNACVSGNSIGVNTNNGACSSISTSISNMGFYTLFTAPAPTPASQQGTCSGSGKVTATPAPTFNAGATCAQPAQLGAGCSAGVCAPPTGMPFKACVAHAGSVACPTFGFTQQVLASTGSPGYVDMRSCGSRPCATALNCETFTNVALFSNGTCAGGPAFNVTNGCGMAGGSANIGSYQVGFTTSGDPTCQPTGASPPTGSVTLDSHVETICCPP
jgi:hypothetical protein